MTFEPLGLPDLFEAYYYHGRTRFHQGDLQMAAEVNPDDYQSRFLRTQILRGLGRTAEALVEANQGIAAVEKHLEWNPDDARALYLGAGSLILSGQAERGERWLQRALVIDPDDSVVLYNVACNYAVLGKAETALDYLEQAIEKGTVSIAWMTNDEDLVSLRTHARYAKPLKKLEMPDVAVPKEGLQARMARYDAR